MASIWKLGISLPGELEERVRELAADDGRSVSNWVAMAIREKIERIDLGEDR